MNIWQTMGQYFKSCIVAIIIAFSGLSLIPASVGNFDIVSEVVAQSINPAFNAGYSAGQKVSQPNTPAQQSANPSSPRNNKDLQSSGLSSDSNESLQKMLQTFVDFLNLAGSILTMLVTPIIMLVGWLMSPDWTSGDLFGLRDPMYKMWITISNVIYFVYAILLIFIAIATIFNSKNYGYRALLPRLFIGILLVPMTWWFVQFVISASSYLTASVMSIPTEILAQNTNTNDKNFMNAKSIPKNITVDAKIFDNTKFIQTECQKDGNKCISPQEVINSAGGIYAPLVTYAYSVFKIQDIQKLNKSTNIADTLFQIGSEAFIGIIMFFVFGLVTIALMVILIVRAFKLWIYTILSPLFTFKIVLRDIWKDDDFDFQDFISLSFLPALIGIILSFGLIIIASISDVTTNTDGDAKTKECKSISLSAINTDNSCSDLTLFGSPNNHIRTYKIKEGASDKNPENEYSLTRLIMGDMNLDFKGKFPVSANGLGFFSDIIVKAIAIVFLWIAFSAAIKVNKIAAKVAEPIMKIGSKVKDLAGDAVGHTVKSIPVAGFGNVAGVGKGIELYKQEQNSKLQDKIARSAVGKRFNMPISTTNTMNYNISVIQNGTGIGVESKAVFDQTVKKAINDFNKESKERSNGDHNQWAADIQKMHNALIDKIEVDQQDNNMTAKQVQAIRSQLNDAYGTDVFSKIDDIKMTRDELKGKIHNIVKAKQL